MPTSNHPDVDALVDQLRAQHPDLQITGQALLPFDDEPERSHGQITITSPRSTCTYTVELYADGVSATYTHDHR